jgi:anti-sigma factor RsiW
MSEEYGKARDGAGLWVRARPGWRSEVALEAPNPLILAAYLDGTLDEAGREAVEAWMAATPEALASMIATRAELGQALEAAPENLVSRAQGLVRAPVAVSAGLGAWLHRLIGFEPEAWRPLAWAGVTAALLLVSAGSFELGRLGTEQLVPFQSAALDDDLDLGLDDPADDFI